MKKILLIIWQFPQLLVGLVISAFSKKLDIESPNHLGSHFYKNPMGDFGVSFSTFIFIPEDYPEDYIRHEEGHSFQSRYLGILYLIAVGIPSVVLFITRRKNNYPMSWYYSHYPENWANKLGKAFGYKEGV